ncbi:MAG: hypothetical protein GY862_03080 [Gammaproteobacteria bacterium]|nr:hypothetical protein [Gammaproteobacteria bacterium]
MEVESIELLPAGDTPDEKKTIRKPWSPAPSGLGLKKEIEAIVKCGKSNINPFTV